MQSLIFATTFYGFEYNNDEIPAPGRNLVFVESEEYWIEVPHYGKINGLEKHVVVVDIASCFNLMPVLTEELTPLQGFELVFIHELVHAFSADEYDYEAHTVRWNETLIPLVREYCTQFCEKEDT